MNRLHHIDGGSVVWVVLDGFGWFWVVLGGFGWFWVVLGGFGWFWWLPGHDKFYDLLFEKFRTQS